jgi:hypothetical protein
MPIGKERKKETKRGKGNKTHKTKSLRLQQASQARAWPNTEAWRPGLVGRELHEMEPELPRMYLLPRRPRKQQQQEEQQQQ